MLPGNHGASVDFKVFLFVHLNAPSFSSSVNPIQYMLRVVILAALNGKTAEFYFAHELIEFLSGVPWYHQHTNNYIELEIIGRFIVICTGTS